MKKLLLGTVALAALGLPAIAADMGVRPHYAPVVAYTNWTGCHVGGLVGLDYGQDSGYTTTPGSTVVGFGGVGNHTGATVFAGQPWAQGFNLSGFTGGGYVGCDYQVSNWVFGVEGDWSIENKSGQAGPGINFLATSAGLANLAATPALYTEAQERWYATARGRLGYAIDKWLFFVSGGAAWTRIDSSYFNVGGPLVGQGGPTPTYFALQNDNRSGWTVGGGFDYAITGASLMPGWSVRVEYLYMNFGNYTTFTTPVLAGTITGAPALNYVTNLNTKLTDNVIRVGFAYKFGNYTASALYR
jgi:outer membrane immunogenic protein